MNWQSNDTKSADKEPIKIAVGPAQSGSITTEGSHIYFFKGVDVASVAELVKALQTVAVANLQNAALHDQEPSPIHLHIHSPGGSMFAGFAAVDAILECQVPVHTHIDGMAASAATFLSMAGHHRTIGRHGYILIHQLSNVMWGKYEELKDDMTNSTVLMNRMKSFYKERGRVPKGKLDEILKHDLWWDAEKALEYGLVDEIRGSRHAAKKK
jgi:ATP-dependent protease ClpP protease subunit